MSETAQDLRKKEPKREKLLMERPDPFLGVKTPQGAKRVKMLGVYYIHSRTSDGGDLFVTKYGLPPAGCSEAIIIAFTRSVT